MEFQFLTWLGTPAWMWVLFIAVVLALLAFDLGVLHRDDRAIGVRESLRLSAFYIGAGLLFGGWVWHSLGQAAGMDFYTGFLIEKSLSLDNVFVISLIFGMLAVPPQYQHRVLFWGILGVIVMRAAMIGAGAALVAQYYWTLYLFGAFLVFTGIKMLAARDDGHDMPGGRLLAWLRGRLRFTDGFHGQQFLVRLPSPSQPGKLVWWGTPLLLALCMIELVDLVFAVDSVPAIFAITNDPFIVYTSNIFAVLGLRALYFALAAVVHRFHYLKYALALILVFIGSKVFLGDFVFGGKVPAALSLAVTVGLLAGGILVSLWKTRERREPREA